MTWSNDGLPEFTQLAIDALGLTFRIAGLSQAPDQPEKLFVSPDSQRLGMTFSDLVVFLPRLPGVAANEFSFANPEEASTVIEMLDATYRVLDLTFSKDRRRVATGHGNRYVQLWDLDGNKYNACESDGLFKHRPGKGGLAACLRGHAKEVEAISFAAGDPDRLLSVSADQSIRTWQVSTYAALVS